MSNQDFIKHCKNAVLLTLDFPMAAYPSSVKRKEHIEQVKQSLNVSCFVCEPKNYKACVVSTADGLKDKCWIVEYDNVRRRYYIDHYLVFCNNMIQGYDVESM